MADIAARKRILDESIERVKVLQFGDPITNVCAGSEGRHSYFAERVTRSRKNRFGLVHKERFVRCTDKKGSFWLTDIKVIYPGHLDEDQCNSLFDPIWQAEHAPTQRGGGVR